MDGIYSRWIALLGLGIVLLAIAIYGWRSAANAAVNRHFAMQTLVVTWWVIGIAGTHSAHAAEFWGRWTFAAAAIAPAAFLTFAEVFPTRGQPLPRVVRRSISVSACLFAIVAAGTPWIAHSFVVTAGVLARSPGPLMRPFTIFLLTSAAAIFVLLARKWRSARGLARAQLRLYYVGLLLFCLGAITTNLLLPSIVGDSRYSTLGPCFVLVFFAFVAHGIIRHRFMNLRLVVHTWLALSISSLVSLLPLVFVLTRLEIPNSQPPRANWMFSVLPLIVAGLLAPPLWMNTRYLLHRYVYRGDADFRTRISEASDRLSRVLAPKETATVVIDTIFAAVRPEGVAVYVGTDTDEQLRLVHSRQAESAFGTPDRLPLPIARDLRAIRLLASFQSVPAEASPPPSDIASAALEMNHWALIFPLIAETKLIGAVAVGGKLSGDPYYVEDVRLLQVLGSQATIAFKNGELYERVLLANQHIANIVATIQSGIVVVYDRHSARVMNGTAIRLLGLPPQLEPPATVSFKDLPTPLVSLLNQTLDLGSSARTVDLSVSGTEGAIPIMCSTAPLRKADGEIVGVVAALSDLSTLKALEIERARAERLNYFETLAAALAHEIANPIAPIKVMTQLLPARHQNGAFIADFTRTVGREISRIEKLVDRLRSLSRPSHRDRIPLDLRAVLRDAIDVMQSLIDERQLRLDVCLCEAPLIVVGDASELQELFLNLLTNAVEATPDYGSIEIEAVCDSAAARVLISDTGPGIPAEIVERIFEPFVSSKQRGSGLGLTICTGIVNRHEGVLSARNLETGALFTVDIPLASDSGHATELGPPPLRLIT